MLATGVLGLADGCPHLYHELVREGEFAQNGVQAAREGLGSRCAPGSLHHCSCCGIGQMEGQTDRGMGWTEGQDKQTHRRNQLSAWAHTPAPSPRRGPPRLPAPLTQLGVPDAHVALQQVIHPARRRHLQVVGLRTGEWPGERRAGSGLINLWWLLGERAAGPRA